MQTSANPSLYLQQHNLSDLRLAVKQDDASAEQAVAKQFEGLFVQMMLKSMRQAALVDPSQHSQYLDFYQEMFDQQLAQNLSAAGGIGLAESLLQNLNGPSGRQNSAANGQGLPLNLPPELSSPRQIFELKAQTQNPAMFALDANIPATPLTRATANPAAQAPAEVPEVAAQAQTSRLPAKVYALTGAAQPLEVELPSVRNTATAQAFALGEAQSRVLDQQPQASDWQSPQQFVAALWPAAQTVAPQLGVKPEVLIAQSVLETGWGQHSMRHDDGRQAFALFGIKADSRWSGAAVERVTTEFRNGRSQQEVASFRAYDSLHAALQDYADFIQTSPRYAKALQQADDPQAYLRELQNAGYATDPAYAQKIERVLGSELLQQGLAQARSEVNHA